MPAAQLNIDCEGPITKNDNAFELCQKFIPNGDKFFSIVSKYDDYLADIARRPGYQAGDTLKLILPFLKAFGLNHQQMVDYSISSLVLLPKAKETLSRLVAAMPTFIISTSYKPYLEALGTVTGFPVSQVYCTSIDMDSYHLPQSEQGHLKDVAAQMAKMPMLDWKAISDDRYELLPGTPETIDRLDEIFWKEIISMQAGAFLKNVKIVGAQAKAEAVVDSMKKTGNTLSEVIYVGDSITDTHAFRLVREGGGIGVSFNGNAYAINTAEICCLSSQMSAILILALLFLQGGRDIVRASANNWKIETLKQHRIPSDLIESYEKNMADFPHLEIITDQNRARLIEQSEKFRKSIRGVAIGSLG